MNIIFFDDQEIKANLLPFTYTRPLADLRIGISTIREKWENEFKGSFSYLTEDYLKEKFPVRIEEDNLLICGTLVPTAGIVNEIKNLASGQSLVSGKKILAAKVDQNFFKKHSDIHSLKFTSSRSAKAEPFMILYTWDIFAKCGEAIERDFESVIKGRKSQTLSKTNSLLGKKELVFLEEGAKVECSILNTSAGPIYISKDAEVMEGSMIRGPFALGEHSALKMGTKIYGPTSIGPHCKIGGEVNNSVVFGYSNKAHDGFLGNSVIGEWCNLGADTNTSNLKNNYSSVKVWDSAAENFADTGLQFCGLMMGDHTKCAINTMFNTGTVVGVNANIFGSGFPAKHIPSFSWDGANILETYSFTQACEVAKKVFERRGKVFSDADLNLLKAVFEITSKDRHWEKK